LVLRIWRRARRRKEAMAVGCFLRGSHAQCYLRSIQKSTYLFTDRLFERPKLIRMTQNLRSPEAFLYYVCFRAGPRDDLSYKRPTLEKGLGHPQSRGKAYPSLFSRTTECGPSSAGGAELQKDFLLAVIRMRGKMSGTLFECAGKGSGS
jgi:hypothetical protein